MKNIIIILSVLLLFGTLLFLSLALYAQNIGEKSGNTNGNLGNKGYLAQSSGWIYYTDPTKISNREGYCLYKMRSNFTGATKLLEDCNVSMINVYDNKIYFVGDFGYYEEEGTYVEGARNVNCFIYRVDLNGKNLTKLIDQRRCTYLSVVNNQLYYIISEDKRDDTYYDLYCADLDGNNKKLIKNDAFSVSIENDKIFYTTSKTVNKTTVNAIYSMDLDGSNDKEIVSGVNVYYLNISDDFIYYLNVDDHKSLYKIKTDGTGKTKIFTGQSDIYSINVYDNYIYYSDGGNLKRIKTDGTEQGELSKNPAYSCISIVNGNVFYFTDNDEGISGGGGYIIDKDNKFNQISTFSPMHLTYKDGWLYYLKYTNDAEDGVITAWYKMRPNGIDETLIGNFVNYEDYYFIVEADLYTDDRNAFYIPNEYHSDDIGLYQYKFDDNITTKIINTAVKSTLGASDGYVVYRVNDNVFSFETNSKVSTKLTEYDWSDNYRVKGGWLYYTNQNTGNLMRMSLDGKTKTEIKDSNRLVGKQRPGYCNALYISDDDYIYYMLGESSSHGSGDLYRIKSDGTEIKLISSSGDFSHYTEMASWNGNVYYIDWPPTLRANYYNVYKINTDGRRTKLILPKNLSLRTPKLYSYGGNLYFTANDDIGNFGYLSRISTDDMKTDSVQLPDF